MRQGGKSRFGAPRGGKPAWNAPKHKWMRQMTPGRYQMYNDNRFKLGLFGANCSSGRAINKTPERWLADWASCSKMANIADEGGIDFILPIGRWKGYGGPTNFQGVTFETVTWASGLLA